MTRSATKRGPVRGAERTFHSMVDEAQGSTRFSLRRWSQRKLAAGRGDEPQAHAPEPGDNPAAADADVAPAIPASVPAGHAAPTGAPRAVATPAKPPEGRAAPTGAIPLPPVESLTIDSDFSPFMQPGVDEAVKRSALRTLLRHPRFNVMDGLDVYIDDYSKPSPLEPEIARALMQARYLFDPPKTRVTADGTVEDVPDAEDASAAADGGTAQMTAADARESGADAIAHASAGDDAGSGVAPMVHSTDNSKP